jgi:hypothetical protein
LQNLPPRFTAPTDRARDRRRIGDRLRIIWKHEDLNARDADQLEDQDEHYRSC